MALYTAAVFIAKMAIYTTAGPTYKNGYIHGSCFYLAIYTAAGPSYKMVIYMPAVFDTQMAIYTGAVPAYKKAIYMYMAVVSVAQNGITHGCRAYILIS